MNKLYSLVLIFLLLGAVSFGQQPLKFGHINTGELLAAMPELKKVEADLEAEYSQKESQLTAMQEDLKKQQEAYMQMASTMQPADRSTKEQELTEMGQKVQNYYVLAQQQIQAKEQELKAPIIQKLRTAIQEVGDENGFLYIFEISGGVAVYHSQKSVDIAPMVKTKLGIN